MNRIAIIENDVVINVVMAPAEWVDDNGRETVSSPIGAGIEIGAQRQPDGSWQMPAHPPMTEEDARSHRDALLAASDWTQVADAPVDQAAWATYRQELRDITAQDGFPESIDWPAAPSALETSA